MGFPILVRAVLDRIPKVVLNLPFARAIHRKGGSRIEVTDQGLGGTLPTPILSLEGAKRGCSNQLQSLITDFRQDGQPSEDALIAYIEDQLGQTLEEAYPEEWAAVQNGESRTLTIDLGTDVVTLTLGLCEGGGEPLTPCQTQLKALVDNVQANPTSVAAMDELIAFIEEETGSVIEELTGDAWADVIADGAEREATVRVCGVDVRMTISGTVVTSITCSALGQYKFTLPVQDYQLGTIQVGTPAISADGSRREIIQTPNFDVHLEHPKLEWLKAAPVMPEGLIPVETAVGQVTVDGVIYRAAIRFSGYYRETLGKFHQQSGAAHSYSWDARTPPVGCHRVRRHAPPDGSLSINDPLRLGSLDSVGNINPDLCDYNVKDRDFGGSNQWASCILRRGSQSPQVRWPGLSGGSFVSFDDAWLAFVANVNSYMSSRTIYQPEITILGMGEIEVRFDTRFNSIYLGTIGCLANTTVSSRDYDIVSINWGGYYYHANNYLGGLTLWTSQRDDSGHDNEKFIGNVQERIILNVDSQVGYTRTEPERVLPLFSGQFRPRVMAVEDPSSPPSPPTPCPHDARCITAGPP